MLWRLDANGMHAHGHWLLYGIAESDGDEPRHGIVLELVEGETLEERIRDGGIGMRDALGISVQIADARGSAGDMPAESLTVVQNWFDELKRLAPPN